MTQIPDDEFQLSPSETAAHNSAMRISGATQNGRSTRKALASIVLGFELIIVVLMGLTIFGLGVTDPRWFGLVIGGGLAVMCLAALGTMRRGEIGVTLGWVTHGLMLLTGCILPVSLFVSAIFTGLWIYCIVRGKKIDDERAAWEAGLA